jgi:malic enzyme
MITNKMLHRSALALASFVRDEDLNRGLVYPSIRSIRKVSEAIALEVCKTAMEDGLARRSDMTMGNIQSLISQEMYYPDYAPLISYVSSLIYAWSSHDVCLVATVRLELT